MAVHDIFLETEVLADMTASGARSQAKGYDILLPGLNATFIEAASRAGGLPKP